jgi:hypothetical protein
MNTLRHSHTLDVVDSPPNRKIVDTKWVVNVKHLADGSVDKFKL